MPGSSLTHRVLPKVRLLFAGQDLESSGLADAVGAHQSQHHPWTRSGEAMELERVGTVTVGSVFCKVAGQVDNVDGLKWAFLCVCVCVCGCVICDSDSSRWIEHTRTCLGAYATSYA